MPRRQLRDLANLPIPRSKFGAPAVPDLAIARSRLMETLDRGDWRVAVVTGGPGTGKTVTVAQWFAALGTVPREWLTLDSHDDASERFWLIVSSALERAAPGAFRATVEAAAGARKLTTAFIDQLLTDWSEVTDPIVLVIDDIHHIRNAEIIEDLAFVIEQHPERSQIVLTSRSDPPLPLARWHARSWIAEIRQRDLAFTISETHDLIASLGEHRLKPIQIAELWLHSEGWIAGLRLGVTELRESTDVAAALEDFSGRMPMVADLLANELFLRAPTDLRDFLLRTSVVDTLDVELCDALSGREDSGEVLRQMASDLQFVTATGPTRDTYRYHPLLLDMLRSELETTSPREVQPLNRLAASVLMKRGDFSDAIRCLLVAGDVDHAFDVVFSAAHRRGDASDYATVLALLNTFPKELVIESAFRMLTYALMLGLCDQMDEAQAWLDRAFVRLASEEHPPIRDVAVLDALRLLSFAVGGGEAEAVDAGRRALDRIEEGLDLGVVGHRTRMNLVRGYLLVDLPGAAESVLHGGDLGDEIATLIMAPALEARVALRCGRLSEVGGHAHTALRAARAFGFPTHVGTMDAYLAIAGAHLDRNELSAATAAFEHIEEVLDLNPETHVYRTLLQLEMARVAAALGDAEGLRSILRQAYKDLEHLPGSALWQRVDAVAVRWCTEFDELTEAEERITGSTGTPTHALLAGRIDLAHRRFDTLQARLVGVTFETMRDEVTAELLLAQAALELGGEAEEHVARAVELAAPEGLIRAFLEESPAVVRMARSVAESVGTETATKFALALGAPPRVRSTTSQSAGLLSEREATVLRFLPTRLSNAEVATECFMSVNTVKTHLKGIYTKLGVSSRSQAVDRARLLGLL
jgi:ATP/maltotriose-dependent transcriptional regulator MalT